MERELQTYRIIKNNLVFLVVFTILLLGYIVFLCYEIWVDSKIKEVPYISACPDYWTLSNDDSTPKCIDKLNLSKCGQTNTAACVKIPSNDDRYCAPVGGSNCFITENNEWSSNLSDALKKKCLWAKHNKVSWDSLESGNIC